MYAIVDLETTGGNPSRDRIIEVAVFIHNGKRVIGQYTSLVNPGIEISPFIQAFTGISNEMVASAPYFKDIREDLQAITSRRVFVAHNVRFDYGFLRNEFKRSGISFFRKQLCTVRLSKAILPNQKAYSLKKLCKTLSIPLTGNHRAFTDAAATADLFDQLIKQGSAKIIEESIKNEMAAIHLPPNLKQEDIDLLPEETGIYYLMNDQNKVAYVGKSKNIRKRVLDHFSKDLTSENGRALKEVTTRVFTVTTGSSLISSLLESHEIKRFMPSFNKAQRRKKYAYGIFLRWDETGYAKLEVGLLNLEEKPLKSFSRRKKAEDFLNRLTVEQGLCCKFSGQGGTYLDSNHLAPGQCNGQCPAEILGLEGYNQKVVNIFNAFQYPHPNFIILGKGRHKAEKSVVAIENEEFKGFGFVPQSEIDPIKPSELKQHIRQVQETPDIQSLILQYLKWNKRDKVLPF